MSTEQGQSTIPVARTLIIRSSEWLRGTGGDVSGLYKNGKFCCLGLDALSAGVSLSSIDGLDYPSEIYNTKDRVKIQH
jgi:hypothetical protein